MNTKDSNTTIMLGLVALVAGVATGISIATLLEQQANSTPRWRGGLNLVFGNIIVGSNNAPNSRMNFGHEDHQEPKKPA